VPGLDEATLRELLEDALADEPPRRPVAANAQRAGIKVRRRRRVQGAGFAAAVVAAVAFAVPAITGAFDHTARQTAAARAPVVYAADDLGRAATVTPIDTATNTPGAPVKAGNGLQAIAITPDGKTAYVASFYPAAVTPITLATGRPGKPISVGRFPAAIAITPNGKTAYVASFGSDTVTPITIATNTAGKPIKIGAAPAAIAITPHGTTA
jgi:YVTN family beta-propeller protein